MKLTCECSVDLPVPALAPGAEQIVFCARCAARVRVIRRPDGVLAATRLARPEIDVRCPCGVTFKAYPPDAGGVIQCLACGRTFTAKKEVKAAAPPRPGAAPPAVAAVSAIVAVSGSPGRNQDRASWDALSATGCVCDGVTTSQLSEQGAEIVCREAPALFAGDPEANVRALAGRLLAERGALMARPMDAGELGAAGGDPRGVAAARSRAYQTTMLAFRVAAARHDELELAIIRCGDCAFLALTASGVVAAVGVRGRQERGAAGEVRHVRLAERAGGTFCIPDGVHAAETCRVAVPRGAWLIAATDGFFDSFETSHDLLAWLETHRADLRDAHRRAQLLAGLHRRLEQGDKGDDDMAFVLIGPEPSTRPPATS